MKWETVIGLETHVQLNTRSKIFSGASTAFGAAPNTQASAVDIALPGVLPVLNRAAVEKAIRFGLAGVKGVGEAGTIGATPAIVNAVVDALSPFGVRHLDMPIKPENVWRIINNDSRTV